MDEATRAALREINRAFYEEQAESFDATRDHPWPGWERVRGALPEDGCRLLDAGCGSGRFARFLAEGGPAGLSYTGLDTSRALLELARARAASAPPGARFVEGDLLDDAVLPSGPFDAITLFGVLHHLPGSDARVAAIARLASRLAPGGRVFATIWRFGSDPRVTGRTLDWPAHPSGIDPAALEPGDHLLRWGDGREIVRYCHFMDDAEIDGLLAAATERGLALHDRFRSDGRSGELNEYLVWERRPRA